MKFKRTLVALPEAELKWLRRVAKNNRKSVAALIRQAVSEYRARAKSEISPLQATAGLWRGGKDGLRYVEALRSEWE